ncbi:MAG: hypothetical protein ACLFOY_15600 [Desulfatibacillaceae bacterium]
MDEQRARLELELEEVEERLRQREASLPAHSARPHQYLELEELEERRDELRRKIAESA